MADHATDYPDPPWRLRGSAFAVPVLLDPARVRVPRPLEALGSRFGLPGALVMARYGEGSSLRYSEAAVLALVRYRYRFGCHVQRLWVDEVASIRGGLEVWGLRKEPAEFLWSGTGAAREVELSEGGRTLVRIAARRIGPSLPVPALARFHVFVARADGCARSRVAVGGRAGPAGVRVLEGSVIPLAVRRGVAGVGCLWQRLDARVFAPEPA